MIPLEEWALEPCTLVEDAVENTNIVDATERALDL
jgi:hypothetical protein